MGTKEQYSEMEKELFQFCQEEAIVEGARLTLIDLDGVDRTFSYHPKYNRLKYHTEYHVPK